MRRIAGVLSLLLLVLAGSPALSKGAPKKKPKPKVTMRVTGASTVIPAAWGLATTGGSQLRIMPTGKTKWQTLHKVKGGHLYRVAVHDSGRLLASWEEEAHFHLFVLKTKEHLTFAKPARPSADFNHDFTLDDIYFTDEGAAAIVYMHGFMGGRTWSTVAYHYKLEAGAEPTLLFRQSGHILHSTPRIAAFATPKKEESSCDYNSCYPLAAITAYEIEGTKATKRVILSGDKNDKLSVAHLVWGSDDERLAVLVSEHPRKRHLLRWRHGQAKADVRVVPDGPTSNPEWMWLTKSDDVIEVWMTDDRALEIKRFPVKGDMTLTTLPPIAKKHAEDYPLFGVYALKERTNGDLIMHRGDYLVLLSTGAAPRSVAIGDLLGKTGEWAGALIYVPEPEGVWIGIDGGGRSFEYVPLAEIEKLAQPAE